MFDTLRYAKRLEASGMTRDQAEVQVHIIAEMVVDGVATKQDLALQTALTQKEFLALRSEMQSEFADVRSEMQSEFAAVRSEMQSEFAAVRSEIQSESATLRSEMRSGFATLRSEMQDLEYRMMLRLGAMIAASTTITVALLAWIK